MATADIHSDFWQKINELKYELKAVNGAKQFLSHANSKIFTTHKSITRNEVLQRMERVFEKLLKDLVAGKPISFTFNKRGDANNTWFNEGVGMQMEENAQMTTVSIGNESSLNKFAIMLRVLSHCYQLLQLNNYSTKRDLYYADKVLFGTQHAVDEVFNDLACMLQIPRSSLHVFASSKGCIKGNLIFNDEDGNLIDCSLSKMGVMVPAQVDLVHGMYSSARFVLLVEKEASFQKLNDDNILAKLGPCIMITAKGFPDVNTRLFLKKIWEKLQIPILALVDADPHGIEIMCVYRYGSKSMTYDAESLTCPSIRWIGVLPSDIQKFDIPQRALIQISNSDSKKMLDLLKRPYITGNGSMIQQIQTLISQGHKAEIESLDAISPAFLATVYLPLKIRTGDWI